MAIWVSRNFRVAIIFPTISKPHIVSTLSVTLFVEPEGKQKIKFGSLGYVILEAKEGTAPFTFFFGQLLYPLLFVLLDCIYLTYRVAQMCGGP